MTFLCKCPSCGRRQRLPEEWLGKAMKCAACAEPFTVSGRTARAEPPAKPAAEAKKTPWANVLKRVLGDPSAAIDAAIPGAISGVLAGFQGPLLAGIISGQATGEIVGRVMTGFIIGFGFGTLLGAFFGAAVKRIRPDFHLQPGIPALLGGAVIGGIVVALVEDFRWIPLGAGIGAASADLWLMLSNRVEAVTRLPSGMASGAHSLDHAERTDHRQRTHRRSRSKSESP